MSVLGPEVRAVLERERVGRLATADAAGRPHVVPFVYAEMDGALWFVVDAKPKRPGKVLRRIRNLEENPHVAVVVDHYDEDWSALEYVLLRGTGRVVSDRDEWRRAIGALRSRYPQYRSMPLDPERNPVVRIDPERAHHWRASRGPDRS